MIEVKNLHKEFGANGEIKVLRGIDYTIKQGEKIVIIGPSGGGKSTFIRLISTCQQVEECLLSHKNCISQPVDLRLLSPAIRAYSAARSVPVSRLRSSCQPFDQHLSASSSAPVYHWVSAC